MSGAPATTPNFLLGVGTQKAGTTWLFDYLAAHPQTAMGAVKEFHFFNLFRDEERHPELAVMRLNFLKNVIDKQIAEAQDGKPFSRGAHFVGVMETMAMQFQPERYHRYFKRILRRNPHTRLIGEITPNYCTLNADDFRFARDEIEKLGLPIRVVFLMREPVERCYSQARMADRDMGKNGDGPRKSARERLLRQATSVRVSRLTRYEHTIRALETVFAPEELFYGIYEDLFRNEEVERLCAFLGIRFVDPDFKKRSNYSPRSEEPDPSDVRKIRAFYADTYAFCRERFGTERIDRLWGTGA